MIGYVLRYIANAIDELIHEVASFIIGVCFLTAPVAVGYTIHYLIVRHYL